MIEPPAACPCGAPVQQADDHPCRECAACCTLERYRRAEAERRAAQQAADDAALRRIHADRIRQRQQPATRAA